MSDKIGVFQKVGSAIGAFSPILGAATNIFGNLLGNRSISQQNDRSEAFSREMYDRRFNDNIRLWNMQNAYNDPRAQMERLRNAGLNPMLMYGSGAGAGGAGQASSINTTDHMPPQFRVQTFDKAANALGSYFDLKMRQAQANNMLLQNTEKFNDIMMKIDKYAGLGPLAGWKLPGKKGTLSSSWQDMPWTEKFQSYDRGLWNQKRVDLMNEQIKTLKQLTRSRILENEFFKAGGLGAKILQAILK